MKTITGKNGIPTLIPETPLEDAAIEWAKEHPCFFAAATPYGITAFQAGAAWQRQNEKRETP